MKKSTWNPTWNCARGGGVGKAKCMTGLGDNPLQLIQYTYSNTIHNIFVGATIEYALYVTSDQ